ncbi:hypothetical protein GmRootV118_23030 [Variovorax sp. V118]
MHSAGQPRISASLRATVAKQFAAAIGSIPREPGPVPRVRGTETRNPAVTTSFLEEISMLAKTRAVAQKYGPKIGAAALTLPFTVLTFAQEAGSPGSIGKTQVDQSKADMLLVAGALLLLAVAVWGTMKIVGMFGRR